MKLTSKARQILCRKEVKRQIMEHFEWSSEETFRRWKYAKQTIFFKKKYIDFFLNVTGLTKAEAFEPYQKITTSKSN